jgi:hypothetical protein
MTDVSCCSPNDIEFSGERKRVRCNERGHVRVERGITPLEPLEGRTAKVAMLGLRMLRRATVLAALLAMITLLLAWAPFLFFSRMDIVVRHFDGPNYLVVAKTFYVPPRSPLPAYALTPWYFAVHPLSIPSFFVSARFSEAGRPASFSRRDSWPSLRRRRSHSMRTRRFRRSL